MALVSKLNLVEGTENITYDVFDGKDRLCGRIRLDPASDEWIDEDGNAYVDAAAATKHLTGQSA